MRGPRIFFCYRASSDPGIVRFLQQLIVDMQMMGAEVVIDDTDEAHADLVLLRHEIARCEKMLVVQTPEAIDSFQVNAALGIALELSAQGPMHGILRLIVTPLAPNNLPWMWDILKTIDITVNYAQARDELLLSLGFTSPESWADTQPSRSISLPDANRNPTPFVLPVRPTDVAPTSAPTVAMVMQAESQQAPSTDTPGCMPPPTFSAAPPFAPSPYRRINLRYAALGVCLLLILSSVVGLATFFNHVQTSEYIAMTATASAHSHATAAVRMTATAASLATKTALAQASATALARRNATATAIAAATATVQAYQPRIYEAESPLNGLSGGARVEHCDRCSGGEKVGYVGHGGVLQFRGVTVSYSGNFTLTLYYGSLNTRMADISVDGGPPIAVNFPATGGFDNIGQQSVVIHLNAGTNTITIYNNNNWAPDFDKILV